MKYAVISDLHANESALRHVLADAAQAGAEKVACLGDVVGYGPLPAETVALARRTADVVLAGNHDDAVSGRIDAGDFVDLALDAVERHREALSKDDIRWLASLPHSCALDGGALAAHGDITAPAQFLYVDGEDAAAANFAACDAQLVFVGHTHVPRVFLVGQSGKVYSLPPQDFTLEAGKRYIVNPGSVGYPREENGECRSSYVLYDSAAGTVQYRFLPFSVASVMQRGRGPRRRLAAVVAAAALAAAAAAGLAYVSVARRGGEQAESAAGGIARKALCSRTVDVSGARGVHANLRVSGGDVDLRIVFRDSAGKQVDTVLQRVKASSTRFFKAPRGAASAELSACLPVAGSDARVVSFEPSAER